MADAQVDLNPEHPSGFKTMPADTGCSLDELRAATVLERVALHNSKPAKENDWSAVDTMRAPRI
ncbi:MAG TPA: hypothetical protein VEV20_10000 [Burkholderiales bacterium]|nr:hypothetical protein [Burkholderiales bacterium]